MAQLSDDCFAVGGGLMNIDAARQSIFERLAPVDGVEAVPLRDAAGRTLAHYVIAPIAVPGFDNSAVDGYAVRFDDLYPAAETIMRCVDRIAGQQPLPGAPQPISCGSSAASTTDGIPSRTSGIPNRASLPATRMSQAAATSTPAPNT